MRHLKYSDIDLLPNYSELYSRADADTSVNFLGSKFMLPIVPANMQSVIDIDLARNMSEDGYFYIMHRFGNSLRDTVTLMNEENWSVISVSMGIKMNDKKDIVGLSKLKQRVDYITIDIAHGHCQRMKIAIECIKKYMPSTKIIAGNVCTSTAVRDLYKWGADAVKVGVGQGSPCTTKYKTGFTMPMFSCVKLCSNLHGAAWEENPHEPIPIIADGGVKHNGDIAKALVAGATMVMAGGMFASCSDSAAACSTIDSVTHKVYFGSASVENKGHNNNIEGKLTNIPCNNMTVGQKLLEITQDLQSSISYAGGKDLEAFKDNNVTYDRN
jgi:GMP reductase